MSTPSPAPAARPQLLGFGIANYRSFDERGFVVRDLKKVNIFIGKNNVGKSNIRRWNLAAAPARQ